MSDLQSRLRELPQVSALFEDERLAPLMTGRRRGWMTRIIQGVVDDFRLEWKQASGPVTKRPELLEVAVERVLARHRVLTVKSWTRVLNGTGVVVHTNLGRSCYPAVAAEAAETVARFNSDLEDLRTRETQAAASEGTLTTELE